MQAYLELLKRIMVHGETVPTGAYLESEKRQPTARTILGAQFRHDLRDGFPAVTTKKLFFDSVVKEVLWFLRGETNVKTLGCGIWNSWSDPKTGECGRIYGYQWRRQEHVTLQEPQVFPAVTEAEHAALIAEYGNPTALDVGFRGNPDLSDPYHEVLQSTWGGMLHRCYNPERKEYQWYGGKGIHVDPRWLVFSNFQADVKRIPGWSLKASQPDQYWLDKDFLASNRYGPQTCIWASQEEQHVNVSKAMLIRATAPNGTEQLVIGASRFAKFNNLDPSSVCKCIRGERDDHKGWRFSVVEVPETLVPRLQIVDQIAQIVADLRAVVKDPTDRARRRIILNSWNPPDIPLMGLPPCHTLAQWLPTNGVLHCHCFWRSIDAPVGMPFNLCQYALLTHIFAAITGYKVGELVASITDLHIYENQFDMVAEQLSRVPFRHPFLCMPDVFDRAPDLTIEQVRNNLSPEMFSLLGYQCHPPLKCEVAV